MIQFLLVCVIVVITSLHVLNEFIYNRFRFLLLSSFFIFLQKKKKKGKILDLQQQAQMQPIKPPRAGEAHHRP